jgi:PUB domain
VAAWGQLSIEDLEDMREDILDRLSELELEATPIFFTYTVEKLITIFTNIINNPFEDKYKNLKMEN